MVKIKNFLFHRVSPVRDLLWDPMDVLLFEKCIKYISHHYQIITIENIPETIYNHKNYATISFDDGYKDNIIYALPILKKYNVKASFYVVTDCIDKNIPTWTYILDFLFSNTSKSDLNLNFNFLPTSHRGNFNLKTHHERLNFVKRLKPILKNLSHEQRSVILNRISELYNDVQIPKIMMDWNDLKQLILNGHTIGSHTVSHSMLGTMQNKDEIRAELEDSAYRIKDMLGFFPTTISYPVGSYNKTVINISKETGYKIGLAVGQEIYEPHKQSIFEIPRIELYNESWIKTYLRITHSLEKLKKLSGRK